MDKINSSLPNSLFSFLVKLQKKVVLLFAKGHHRILLAVFSIVCRLFVAEEIEHIVDLDDFLC